VYTNPQLHQWWSQWKYLTRSDITLQAMDSQTCGHDGLFFLKARAQGQTYQDFLGRWSSDNLVLNDHKVAEDLKRVIKRELQDEVDARPDGQKNASRQAFMLCNHCLLCKIKKQTGFICQCVCVVSDRHKKGTSLGKGPDCSS